MNNYYDFGTKTAKNILIQMADAHDLETIENEIAVIKKLTKEEFWLLVFPVEDWNNDLSPWEAPAVFGKEGFGGRASGTLARIEETLAQLEETSKQISGKGIDEDKRYIIGGYSLAGLFALWAAHRSERFFGVAAASPSMWFPEFTEFMKNHELCCEHVYLSLGDKEARTRNHVMATVEEKIRQAYALLQKKNVNCILEMNQGNHFKDADVRTAKAFSWVLSNAGSGMDVKSLIRVELRNHRR